VSDPAAGVGVLAAMAAGAVSFLSPCVLPLVPGYLSAVVGVAPADLGRAGARRVLPSSLVFVGSFSLVFILLGLGATSVGSALRSQHAALEKGAAGLIIGLGVYFLATTFVTRLNREWHVD
jgi:cytochrome c-type biogenesis protein